MSFQEKNKQSQHIDKIESTTDNLTGRGGLALFSRYIEKIQILDIMANKFGFIRKSRKGLPVRMLFHQILCWFFDGTSRHLSYFDQIKKDEGYASVIETSSEDMASSHSIKRFFSAFGIGCAYLYRKILHKLFIWRLKIEKPLEIRLYQDSMILNNNDANKRQGVQPTYKKVKGFQPLQVIWNGMIVDAIFRGGKKNCNYESVALNMVTGLVKLIRKEYRDDVPIFLHVDSGFFDQNNYIAFDALDIAFIGSGKMYDSIKTYVETTDDNEWGEFEKGKKTWKFLEFGFRCGNWKRFFRAVYTHLVYEEDGQMLLDFARPDNILITNIGMNSKVLENCTPERKRYWLDLVSVIGSYHQCGADELAHRSLKNLGFECLPFEKFTSNMSLFYCMLITFFLFECFKRDVLNEIIPIGSYPETVRRLIVDIPAKIVRTSRTITLKVTHYVMKNLKFDILWRKCQNPVPIIV